MPANRPRKQARQARSKATQDAILEAAARILEGQGRESLTTNRIALKAGVSIGSLYQYFPNKEAILATLVRNKRAEIRRLMAEAMENADAMTPEDAVDALVRAGMMHQFTRPALALELEALEPQLALSDETAALSADMARMVLQTVRRLAPQAGQQEAADVVAICKGLIRAAAMAGETGGEALYRRCRIAATGYLRECATMPQ